MKPGILVLVDWYLPGHKAGGAVSAVSNLIELVGDDFAFWVFTRDRDLTDQEPYPNVPVNRWVTVGKAHVYYASQISLRNLRNCVREIHPDIIYLNSFFSRLTVGALMLRKLGLLPFAAVVLAPRGEFSQAALHLKRRRKWFYRKAALGAKLLSDVLWQASSLREQQQIRATIGSGRSGDGGNVQLASDVPNLRMFLPPSVQRPAKLSGTVRLIFLSRVSRIKNLKFALELVASAKGQIQFDIYGPVDDKGYWKMCEEQIARFPKSVRVNYLGPLAQEQVLEVFAKYHFQLLPTLGENFGYTILEGLAASCPVLTSDQTPWRELWKHGAGWDLPLEDRARWQCALQDCVEMDQDTYKSLSLGARTYFEQRMSSSDYRRGALELFHKAIGANAAARNAPALEKSARAGD